jgi:hypothetical protein
MSIEWLYLPLNIQKSHLNNQLEVDKTFYYFIILKLISWHFKLYAINSRSFRS